MLSASVVAALRDAVGGDGLIVERNQLQTYECDGLAVLRSLPAAVVLPRTTAQLQGVVTICAAHGIPFVARGAGTGLSGGALPDDRGIVISFARMTRVVATDLPNQRIPRGGGRDQCARYPTGGGRWILLCAGSFFAVSVHHRRQCCGKLRRGALPQVRLHHHARTGVGSGFAERRTCSSGLAYARCSGLRFGRRVCWIGRNAGGRQLHDPTDCTAARDRSGFAGGV